jgi:hypothetical protein
MVLSWKKYESSITKTLKIIGVPIERNLQAEIQDIDHLDALQQFDKKFVHLALGLQQIWSFYEAKETTFRVKVKRASAVPNTPNPQAETNVTAIVS